MSLILGWSLVWDAIRRFGHTTTLRFPHPAFHFAIERLGGWAQLCATATVENEPFKRRDFEKVFNFGLEVASWGGEDGKIRVSAYLMGLNDASNRQRGYLHGRPQVLDAVTGDILSSEVLALPDSEGRSKATDISALIGNLAVSKSVFGGGLR